MIKELLNKALGKYQDDYKVYIREDFDPFSHLGQDDTATEIVPTRDCVLTISEPNSKLGQINAPSFSLPAGYTCPFAQSCKSFAHRDGKKAYDGKAVRDVGDIRCYAASAEVAYPAVRKMRWRNFDLLNSTLKASGVDGAYNLLLNSIKYYEQTHGPMKVFRIHDSGDFFSMDYFAAWIEVAKARPEILFYAYTKSLPFWKEKKYDIPKNLRLIASEGGKADELINKEGFRKAVIVRDQGEAIKKQLHIDVNDFLAAFGDKDFALLLHGVQSAESGNTKQSMENSKIIKNAAMKFKTSPQHLEQLLKTYTN